MDVEGSQDSKEISLTHRMGHYTFRLRREKQKEKTRLAMKVMKAPDERYLRLIERFPLLPIETEKDYARARALLHELIEHDEILEVSEIGYAKVLGKLIQDYSQHKCQGLFSRRVPVHEILQSLMADHSLSHIDVAELTGLHKQNVNAYLNNRRPLPREAREALGKRFKVNPELFTGE